jgi:hypothetical protein
VSAVAELLSALAALAWPVVVGGVIWIFQKQFGDILVQLARLLARMKRWKGLGQEVELDRQLDHLEVSTAAAVEEVARIPSPEPAPPNAKGPDVIAEILEVARSSPKLALIRLAQEIEAEVGEIMASTGWGPANRITGLRASLSYLKNINVLPQTVAGSIDTFYKVRNQVVHSRATTDAEALRALDSGITLLRGLKAIPRSPHIVEETGIPIFADAELRTQLSGWGVLIKSTSPGGLHETRQLYPTTRAYFVKGTRVAREFNSGATWPEAWYRDPTTGESQHAWASSMEFIGRLLD